ncbi:MAG: hypothetical protein IAC78_03175 [Firmicutes bacterium]|uniref:Uncharacterized protein n=1 Tax=Candidatus Scatoplasma merdavium TaxID=2840932 RepID=A0A9D9GM23_9BACL|nr:hypothetical protein [Candidatus Scatoplasma merdavium]
MRELNINEMKECKGGEALTLAAVMAVMVIAIVVVMCYRFFASPEGQISLPGGYEFEWGNK